MKNTPLKTLRWLIFSFVGVALPAHAQMGTAKWRFQNRAQVEAATRKYKMNLRESYNIIMCAARQGMIRSVVHTYEQIMPKNVFDVPPEMASSFALACRMMQSRGWDWKVDNTPNITKISANDALTVSLYRDRALQMLPNSPEVLVSYAIWATDRSEQCLQALQLSQKAVRLAPRWADAHYWHSIMLNNEWLELAPAQRSKQGPRYGAAELRALNTGVRLDRGLKQLLDKDKSTIYQTMGRPREALIYFDAYAAQEPGYAVFWDKYFGKGQFKKMRDGYVAEAQKK